MKRILSIILVLVIVFTISLPVLAAENEITISPRYSNIAVINAQLSINSNTGVATCRANSGFTGASSQKLTCTLQRKSGSSWVTVKSWSTTSTASALLTKYYAVTSGHTYRLRVTCYVYNSSGTVIEVGSCNSN